MKNYKITTDMAQAAMNAGDMPDIGNAFAAINAAFEEMEGPRRYRLDSDDDGHWYLVPEGKQEAFSTYVYEDGPEVPEVVRLSGHPNSVTFEAPAEFGRPVG